MSKTIKLSTSERIVLFIFGNVKIGYEQEEGLKKPDAIYAFKCPEHGLVSSNLKGHEKRLECPHCWERKKEMEKNPDLALEGDTSTKSFAFWFYLFAMITVILVAFFKDITVASAHSLALMILVRQMSTVYKAEKTKINLESQLKTLSDRMDKIDPYKED